MVKQAFENLIQKKLKNGFELTNGDRPDAYTGNWKMANLKMVNGMARA